MTASASVIGDGWCAPTQASGTPAHEAAVSSPAATAAPAPASMRSGIRLGQTLAIVALAAISALTPDYLLAQDAQPGNASTTGAANDTTAPPDSPLNKLLAPNRRHRHRLHRRLVLPLQR